MSDNANNMWRGRLLTEMSKEELGRAAFVSGDALSHGDKASALTLDWPVALGS